MLKIITKSTVVSSAVIFAYWAGTQLALAQAKCMIDGQEVPCEVLGSKVKGFLGWGIGIFLGMVVLAIFSTVFWIKMIVHASRHQINNKGIWIVVLILTGIIGALIYYFTVKRKFNDQFSATTTPLTP